MPQAPQRDITLQRGSTAPLKWRFKNGDGTLFDLTGSTLSLELRWRGQALTKTNGSSGWVVSVPDASVTWTPSVSEVAQPPVGRVARYRLTRAVQGGEVRPLVEGYVVVAG